MAENKWIIDGHHYTCANCEKTIAIVVNESDEGFDFCPFCGKRMSSQMAENKMAEILVKQAYEKGRQDLALRILDEINQIDIYGTDEYMSGANWAICEVIDIIRRLAGDSDGRE